MKNTITQVAQPTIVSIEGTLDILGIKKYKQQLKPILKEELPNISIDCTNLQYISSYALRSLITLAKYVDKVGGNLFLTDIRPEIEDIFDMTGFSGLVKKSK